MNGALRLPRANDEHRPRSWNVTKIKIHARNQPYDRIANFRTVFFVLKRGNFTRKKRIKKGRGKLMEKTRYRRMFEKSTFYKSNKVIEMFGIVRSNFRRCFKESGNFLGIFDHRLSFAQLLKRFRICVRLRWCGTSHNGEILLAICINTDK